MYPLHNALVRSFDHCSYSRNPPSFGRTPLSGSFVLVLAPHIPSASKSPKSRKMPSIVMASKYALGYLYIYICISIIVKHSIDYCYDYDCYESIHAQLFSLKTLGGHGSPALRAMLLASGSISQDCLRLLKLQIPRAKHVSYGPKGSFLSVSLQSVSLQQEPYHFGPGL